MEMERIETARLVLRPVAAEDEASVVAGLSGLEVSRWLAVVPHPYGPADFTAFLTSFARPGQTWTILEAGTFAGIIGLEGGRLGYWLTPGAQGRGLATEAARAVLAERFLRDESPVHAGYFAENARSWAVLTKLGFTETGRAPMLCRALGTARDHVDLVLTRAAFVAALPWEARSPRLTYRPRQATDVPALHDLVSRPDVLRNLGPKWPWPADPAFSLTRSRPYRGQGFVWGMFRDGIHIGSIGVTEGELGYMLHPDHQGQGLACEAVELALTQAFDVLGLDRVQAGVWADNLASRHLLARFGFTVTANTLGTNALRPEPSPGFDLELGRDAWAARGLIRTPRLVMRAMTRADAPLFHDLVTRPEVARFLYLFHPGWTLAEAETFLEDWAWRGRLRFRLALIHQGTWAGWIGVTDDPEPEVFYALRPEHAGQGLGSEALAAFTRFLFDHFPIAALTAGVFTDNPASARVLEKQGFTRLREEVHASKGRLAPAPLWVYRLERPSTSVIP